MLQIVKVLRALSWQATPGLFAYRADIARRSIGSEIQKKFKLELATWENLTLLQQNEKLTKMLSGYDDAFHILQITSHPNGFNANNNVVDQK